MDIVTPTPIQKMAIGPVLAGRDVIAQAQTGTGKTLAFGAPILSRLDPSRRTVLALVLCPTRELAQQVAKVIGEIGARRGLGVSLIVGGEDMRPQIKALKAGAQIVVGTPGRVLDLMRQRYLVFPWLEFAVLDEADKMFEIGFLDDVRAILAQTPAERQTLLFSATYADEVLELGRDATRDPIELATASGTATVAEIAQRWIAVSRDARPDVLGDLIAHSAPDDVFLVFCERREGVNDVFRQLKRRVPRVWPLHGGLEQEARFKILEMFRNREVKALIATDVAARGLDVLHVSHVVNYHVPREVIDYAHRIGRTGRAGRSGIAITLVTPEDQRRWRDLRSQVDWDIVEIEAPAAGRRAPRPRSGNGHPRHHGSNGQASHRPSRPAAKRPAARSR